MRPPVLPSKKARELDRRASEEYGIPPLILMENAGRTLSTILERSLIPPIHMCHLIFVCGSGNNGGDGYVAARHLHQRRVPIEVFYLGDPANFTEDAGINFRIIKNLGVPCHPFSDFAAKKKEWDRRPVVLVDALLGTGFKPPLRAAVADAIRQINDFKKFHNSSVKIVAVDVPSGLNVDGGPVQNEAVRADMTVTFACYKPGLLQGESATYAGRVEVVDIGIPEKLLREVVE